jgi:hypothetical protein
MPLPFHPIHPDGEVRWHDGWKYESVCFSIVVKEGLRIEIEKRAHQKDSHHMKQAVDK